MAARSRILTILRVEPASLCFLVLAVASCSGPGGLAESLPGPGNGQRPNREVTEEAGMEVDEDSLSPGRLQTAVMDFADAYVTSTGAAVDAYIAVESDPAKRVAARYWKVRYGSAAMTIAASRDPRTNILDMVVFITAGRWAVDSHWVPGVFGTQAAPLSEVYREQEEQIWTLASRVLSLRQQADLRQLIRNWQRDNPSWVNVADLRLRNLDGVQLRAFDDGLAARGILAGVRKFLGRVDTSLLYGERVLFYLERTPRILSGQTDLTLAQIGEAFPIATVNPTALVAGVSGMVKDLPALLQQGIDRNQGTLNTLLPQVGTTLESANRLAQTLNESLLSVRDLASRTDESGVLRIDPAPLVKDATQALAHLDSSIAGLNQLAEKLSAAERVPAEISRQIDVKADRMMDAAFHRVLVLLAVFFGGVACVLVIARLLFRRERRPTE